MSTRHAASHIKLTLPTLLSARTSCRWGMLCLQCTAPGPGSSHPYLQAVSLRARGGAALMQGLFYIPDALTQREEQAILEGIDAAPASRCAFSIQPWT